MTRFECFSPGVVDRLIGSRIFAMRRQRGLTRAALAERAGLFPEDVAAVERGERVISVSLAQAVARALGVATGDLIRDSSPPESADVAVAQVASFLMSPAGLEVAELASQLSDFSRERLVALVQVMVAQEARGQAA